MKLPTRSRCWFLVWGSLAGFLVSTGAAAIPNGTGEYIDANGDGRVDSIRVRFDAPLEGNIRFHFSLCGSSWELDQVQMRVDSNRTVFSAWLSYANWGNETPLCTEVDPTSDFLRLLDSGTDSVIGTTRMLDRIPPFVKMARLASGLGGLPDSLQILTSEPVKVNLSRDSLILRYGSHFGIPVICHLNTQPRSNYLLLFFLPGTAPPMDSVRLSPYAVTDLNGNAPGAIVKWTPVEQVGPIVGTLRQRSPVLSYRPEQIDALGRRGPVYTKSMQLDGFWSQNVRLDR